MGWFPQLGQFSKLAVNHTPFPRMADFSHNWAKTHVIRTNRSNTSTVPMPWRYVCRTEKDHQLTPSDHFPATCRCQESSPDRSRCTRGTLCNHDLKDRMSPNYERSDTVHCLLGNILISNAKEAIFIPYIIQNETIIWKNIFIIAISARSAYDSYPILETG